jgi:acetyltransferase EpsM
MNKASQKVVIIGAVGTALNIKDQLQSCNSGAEVVGFVFDTLPQGTLIQGIPVVCGTNDLKEFSETEKDIQFIFSLYHPKKIRERSGLIDQYDIEYNRYYSFIHPNSFVSKTAKVGVGTIVFSGCSIMNNVVIGNHCIVNSNVVIEHDTVIENHNFISAGSVIGSNVRIGDYGFLGLNASVRENVALNCVVVGMGSVVLHNFENCTIAGNPARELTSK